MLQDIYNHVQSISKQCNSLETQGNGNTTFSDPMNYSDKQNFNFQ